jgi:SAM-dependent methyltransferase
LISNAKQRFSDRVAYYVRARPRYPAEVLTILRDRIGFSPAYRVADIGSGTGIFTELLLSNGNEVFAVEPNADMRLAAEELIGKSNPKFHSIAGASEATTLAEASVDLVTAAQAFHWFEHPRTREEFQRILKPRGYVVLLWNNRRNDDPFLAGYQQIIDRHSLDHDAVKVRAIDAESEELLRPFFGDNGYQTARLANQQLFDFAGLLDRVHSSSYMPLPGSKQYDAMIGELRAIYDQHQRDGKVAFHYDTNVYYGRIT